MQISADLSEEKRPATPAATVRNRLHETRPTIPSAMAGTSVMRMPDGATSVRVGAQVGDGQRGHDVDRDEGEPPAEDGWTAGDGCGLEGTHATKRAQR